MVVVVIVVGVVVVVVIVVVLVAWVLNMELLAIVVRLALEQKTNT